METVHSVRAAPRRARRNPNEAPVFLQKTFEMIDTCPPDVGGWSENGDTFIVKQMEAFADLLPNFFKHRNFRSFVRQLNFYGFRKLRTDGAMVSDRPAHWWEFRHEKFLRGQRHLLTQIKRANHFETGSAEQGEQMEDLKTEVSSLRERVDEMNGTIDHLTTLVEKLLQARQSDLLAPTSDLAFSDVMPATSAAKKRKLQAQPEAGLVDSQQQEQLSPPEGSPEGLDLSRPLLEREASVDIMRDLCDEKDGPWTMEGAMEDSTTSLLRNLSIDSELMDTADGTFDSMFEQPNPSGAGAGGGLSMTLPASDGTSVEMPPVAPYLATAAIGALFTKLVSDTSGQALLNGQTAGTNAGGVVSASSLGAMAAAS